MSGGKVLIGESTQFKKNLSHPEENAHPGKDPSLRLIPIGEGSL